jgi:cell division protein FtsA
MSSLEKRASAQSLRTPASQSVAPRAAMLAALDIGASKVTCFIGSSSQGPGPLRVAGVGAQASRGVRNGVIVDMDLAFEALRASVEQAERMAATAVSDVVVSVSGFGVRADHLDAEIPLPSSEITARQTREAVAAAMRHVRLDGRHMLHASPAFFVLDGHKVRDPRGMMGKRLGVRVTVISVPAAQWRNVVMCAERAHLNVLGALPAPWAAALAALAEDELETGALLVDMGARSTTAALVSGGALAHVEAVPIGSDHVTQDIAQCFSTPAQHAERLKMLYGSAIASLNEDAQMIDAPQYCDDGSVVQAQMPRSLLTGIVRPRVEETFELLRDLLVARGALRPGHGRRIVLTGGGAQLAGVRELAARIFEGHVRVGRPQRYAGLGDAVSGPAFAVPAGLLRWGVERPGPVNLATAPPEPARNPVVRAATWLRDVLWQ